MKFNYNAEQLKATAQYILTHNPKMCQNHGIHTLEEMEKCIIETIKTLKRTDGRVFESLATGGFQVDAVKDSYTDDVYNIYCWVDPALGIRAYGKESAIEV